MSLYRFTPGEKANQIPGRTWNRLVDGEERDSRRGPPSVRGPEGGSEGENPSPARVLIKNDSGSDAPTGGVLKLTGVVHEPADEPGCEYSGPIFTGDTPAANEQHVAILSEPIADGFLGWGVIPNAAWAKVNVSDEDHEFAQPKASVAELVSSASVGFPIIWKELGTGADKWAVISLVKPGVGSSLRWGQATSAISAATGWAAADRGSGTVQFYDDDGDPDGDPVDVESMFWDSFDDDSVVCVDTSFDPARVVSVGCTVVS